MGSFHILLSDSRLIIEDPPIYWAATFFIVVALIALMALSGQIYARLHPSDREVSFQGERRSLRELGFGWKMPVVTFLILLGTGYASAMLLQTSSLSLDRQHGTYTLQEVRLFLVPNVQTGQLSDIDYATLETGQGTDCFVIVLQGGHRFSLGAFTDTPGQSEAVAAVNTFLRAKEATNE